MLKTRDYVMYELRSYASPKSKLTQMIKKGEIIQIVRTVYADSLSDPKLAAASMIYSPCYISFESALAYHQMRAERVFEVKSAAFQLKKEKHFDTPFGRYSFLYTRSSVSLGCGAGNGTRPWFSSGYQGEGIAGYTL